MKISTKGRYALRLMLDLALQDPGTFVNLKSIAARQQISVKYLEQLITPLAKRNLVVSARGTNGGYRLVKKPEAYTVGEILRATEGSLAPVTCIEGDGNHCAMTNSCATIDLWRDIQKAINSVIDHQTLADLVARQKEKCKNQENTPS